MTKEVKESANLLDYMPVRVVEWEKREDELVTLLRPKFSNKLFKKYLLPRMRQPYYKIYLDTFGSYVWTHCNGSTTIGKIGEKLQQEFGQEVEPVYDRLALYIRQLVKARFITLPPPAAPEDTNRFQNH